MTPPHLTGFQQFTLEVGTNACKHYLLECVLDSSLILFEALAQVLDIGQDELQIQVRDMISLDDKEVQTTVAGWLERYGYTMW